MNSNQCGRILEHKQQRKGKRASVASFSVTKFFFLSSYLLHFSVQICPFSSREIIVNRPLLRSTRSRDFHQAAFVGLVWPSDERKWLGQPWLHIRPLTQRNTYGVCWEAAKVSALLTDGSSTIQQPSGWPWQR